MAYSYVRYTGNGSTQNYVFPFSYINSSHIKVRLNGVLNTNFSFLNASTIQLTTAPASGVVIEIRRETPKDSPIVNFTDGSILLERDLDLLATFDTYVAQETEDDLEDALRKNSIGVWDANSSRLASVTDPVNAQDAATKNYVDTGVLAVIAPSVSSASASASAAAASAASASASETSATASASSASASAGTATTQATNASNYATAASNSAIAAAAAAASGLYSNVVDKSANYTVVAADAGDLIRVDTSSAAVTITLPQISTLSDGFKLAVVKWSSDANTVTIVRSGSDTINGATTNVIGSQYAQSTFVADFETNQWFVVSSGLGVSNVTVDVFSGNNSTTAFTLSGQAGSKNNTYVFIGGVYQAKSTYSLSSTTITFSTAPPAGTNNVEVVWTSPLAIGTPSDGTVTAAKMATGAAAGNLGFTPLNKAGDSMTGNLGTKALLETATITPSAPASTTQFDVVTQAIQYYTTNAANNFTLNLRASSGASLDSIMAVGQSITVALLVTNGATPYYPTAFTVDGSAVTPKWQGGSAPTGGNASSIDIYSVTAVKTASATFTLLVSQSQFK